MGTSVSLSDSDLAVDPGASVTTRLRVRNTGEVVDQFVFQPLGDAAAWVTVEPAMVRLFPDSDEEVTVTIAPPRASATAPGPTSWAVKAVPQEDPLGAAVAEGMVDVGTFTEFAAELQPSTGRGRLTGRFDVAIDNRGNVPLTVRTSGTDAEQALDFEVTPPILETEPGSAHFSKLRIKPAKKIWKGQPVSHPFELLLEPQRRAGETVETVRDDDEPVADTADAVAPITINGNLLQEPVIPTWLWKALLVAVALLLALWVLWKTVLKPNIESAARDIAIEEVAEVEEQVAEVEEQVDEQQAEVAAVAEDIAEVEEDVAAVEEDVADGGAGGSGGLGNVFNETTVPSNLRLELSAAVGANDTASAAALGTDDTFAITDMVLQNPRGDLGTIEISIGGQTVIEASLGSFRVLDEHYVAPYVVSADAPLSISVECTGETQVPADNLCDPAVSFSGFLTTVEEAPAEG